MPRPFLLFVDGDPARTPSLIQAMEQDGWRVEWARGAMTPGAIKEGLTPDLTVVDPGNSGSGFELVKMLRTQAPKLPVLVMTEGNTHHGIEIPVQGFLQRNQADAEIAAAVRRFRPGTDKLSTEDIFGDLLEDLGEAPIKAAAPPSPAPPPYVPPTPAPPPKPEVKAPLVRLSSSPAIAPLKVPPPPPPPAQKTPPAPPAPAPIPVPPSAPASAPAPAAPAAAAAAPSPQKLLSQQDLFGDLVEELEAAVPAAAGRAAAGSSIPTAELPAVEAAEDESTLSGISGADDPFAWKSGEHASHTPTPAPSTAAQQAPLTPMEEYGNYYLLDKIAVGGMAELFKAQQRGEAGFRKIVAIKRILPHLVDNEDFVTMFIDEAKLAAQLTHPNIVQIFDLGKAGNSYYIAMEYVNGRDLRTLLRKVREYALPVPEAVAAFVVMKVAAALDYAHRKKGFDDRELKLVHRDISPQNVLISSEGAVKLVDFGIAKAATKASHTVAGALKGKLLYMSPEQALGQPLDNRSDIYSLGLVLFEMLTGERCFQADSEMGVLEKVRLGRIADIRSLNPLVSKDMIDVVGKALQKSVDHRYPSARLMERDLRELLMKRGHIPTEHEVSEYVEAALMGPRERVETVMHARFPLPTMPLSGMSGPHSATQPAHQPQASPVKLPPSMPLPEMDVTSQSSGPGWLLPVILALGVLIIGLLLYFSSR